jgi:uncharacterized membrane protein
MKPVIPLALALLALAGCSGSPEPAPTASESAVEAPPAMASAEPVEAPVPAPAQAAAPKLPARFRATGTEPFWGAEVAGATLRYSTPEFPDGTAVPVTRAVKDGAVVFSGTIDGKPIELAVSAGPCSDGMSDTVYPWSAARTIGPDIERGCARE